MTLKSRTLSIISAAVTISYLHPWLIKTKRIHSVILKLYIFIELQQLYIEMCNSLYNNVYLVCEVVVLWCNLKSLTRGDISSRGELGYLLDLSINKRRRLCCLFKVI